MVSVAGAKFRFSNKARAKDTPETLWERVVYHPNGRHPSKTGKGWHGHALTRKSVHPNGALQ